MRRATLHAPEHQVMVELLRDLRLQAGLSQKEVGDAVDLEQTKVSAIEVGRRGLDYLQVRELVELYGVSMARFAVMLDERIAGKPYQRPPRRTRRDRKSQPTKAPAAGVKRKATKRP
jgi:transcriptional regulator with XRE-family HTH domain